MLQSNTGSCFTVILLKSLSNIHVAGCCIHTFYFVVVKRNVFFLLLFSRHVARFCIQYIRPVTQPCALKVGVESSVFGVGHCLGRVVQCCSRCRIPAYGTKST